MRVCLLAGVSLIFAGVAALGDAGNVPSCALQGNNPPCPLPGRGWSRTWQLNRSTICQPGNTAGYLDAQAAARWGLVSLDWSIANGIWNPSGRPANETTGATTLVEQCRQIKAVDPTTKCLVYRNTELALEWLEPQRAAMQNAADAGLFMTYQAGNPDGKPVGTIYDEDAGGPCAGCHQYFWNYSNPATVKYVLLESEQGNLGTASPYVDGTFLDDVTGIPAEHDDAPRRMNLSPAQVAELQNATNAFVQAAIETLASSGKYIWQAFAAQDGVWGGPTASTCTAFMARVCAPQWQNVPWALQWDGTNQTLAAFLIGRGEVAYIGYGWDGLPLPAWEPIWDTDVGQPVQTCQQTSSGVFSRKWSKGTATLDCNTWTATLAF